MTWTQRLEADRNTAMKARDRVRLATLRLLLSEFKYAAIAKGEALSDDESLQLVVRATKKRREAIEAYEGAGRQEREPGPELDDGTAGDRLGGGR